MKSGFRINLRKELEYQGMMVKELSAKTGISIATLECYLGARSTVPSVEAAVKIAGALQVSVEYLVKGINPENKRTPANPDPETQELIRLIGYLSPEQSRAILHLIYALKVKPLRKTPGTKSDPSLYRDSSDTQSYSHAAEGTK
ncbi:MAG: helix-turn-helix domain-containing protein [Treponema sp.]|nr:helix-turn-helix domain-containing protein [Treponema sp.]